MPNCCTPAGRIVGAPDYPHSWVRELDTDCAGFVPTTLAPVIGASSERCQPAYNLRGVLDGRYWDIDSNCDDGEPWFPLAP